MTIDPALTIAGHEVPVVGRARMYICGITPYDATHLGHAATFVWADLAARVLRATGVEVDVCRNITDVDEELLARAAAKHVSWRGLASQQTYRFERDMEELRVLKPAHEPKSFDYVGEVVSLAQILLAREAAYERGGSVYFRGAGVAEAAGLAREDAVELAAQRGGHPDDPGKDDPLDAVLWERVGDAEPGWPSPWGRGRPGWHAECTAMALSTVGPGIDVHVGGADLAFPHHAFEAAQAEAAIGVRPFARSWLRVGTVMVNGEKMAKSAGNLIMVHDLLERWSADTIRLLLLDRPWADPWEFSEAALDEAAGRLDELWRAGGRERSSDAASDEVRRVLLDDLDVPGALAVAEDAGGRAVRELAALLGLT